jgi:hypothetical protein
MKCNQGLFVADGGNPKLHIARTVAQDRHSVKALNLLAPGARIIDRTKALKPPRYNLIWMGLVVINDQWSRTALDVQVILENDQCGSASACLSGFQISR